MRLGEEYGDMPVMSGPIRSVQEMFLAMFVRFMGFLEDGVVLQHADAYSYAPRE